MHAKATINHTTHQYLIDWYDKVKTLEKRLVKKRTKKFLFFSYEVYELDQTVLQEITQLPGVKYIADIQAVFINTTLETLAQIAEPGMTYNLNGKDYLTLKNFVERWSEKYVTR